MLPCRALLHNRVTQALSKCYQIISVHVTVYIMNSRRVLLPRTHRTLLCHVCLQVHTRLQTHTMRRRPSPQTLWFLFDAHTQSQDSKQELCVSNCWLAGPLPCRRVLPSVLHFMEQVKFKEFNEQCSK